MKTELKEQWEQAGIHRGDTVLIHSSLRRTIKNVIKKGHKLTPLTILESFLEAVGSEGTLIFPLFNFDFTRGTTFDINETPSQMGVLTEEARIHDKSIRTCHPIYSFAVIGKNKPYFENVDNMSGYGHDSPFAILRQLNGKIAVLDLPDQNSMTFYHHIEEMSDVTYRYHKEFTGQYISKDATKSEKTYSLFVRDLEKGVLTHVNLMGELLWKEGLYRGDYPLVDSGLRTISAREMFTFVTQIIQDGNAEGLLYKLESDT